MLDRLKRRGAYRHGGRGRKKENGLSRTNELLYIIPPLELPYESVRHF
jgi:hypothetical protein